MPVETFITTGTSETLETSKSGDSSAHVFPMLVWDRLPTPNHVGLVLGGGGARGFAHIGVLEVLEEANIPIHMIVGCSAGAIVGALFAAGISAAHQHELVRGLHWSDLSTLSLRPPKLTSLHFPLKGFPLGLLDLDRLIKWMDEALDEELGENHDFAALKLPFAAIATDIVTSEVVVMNDGAVGPAVRASCSVPGVFTPYRRATRLLVDGGVIANLPVEVIHQMGAEYVIGVDLLPVPSLNRKEPESIVEVSLTSLYALIRANQAYGEQADCTIAPDIAQFSFVDLAAAEELIAAGRAAAEIQLPKLRRDLGLLATVQDI
jgi:NTE family protein